MIRMPAGEEDRRQTADYDVLNLPLVESLKDLT